MGNETREWMRSATEFYHHSGTSPSGPNHTVLRPREAIEPGEDTTVLHLNAHNAANHRVGSVQIHSHPSSNPASPPTMGSMTSSALGSQRHQAIHPQQQLQSGELMAQRAASEQAAGLPVSHPSLKDVMGSGMGHKYV